jgi:ribosomal protein S18 acetylase RimI-like enzyme
VIRVAIPDDIRALLEIEHASFQGDRISRRSFRHLLTAGNSLTLVDARRGHLRGYITLLFRSSTTVARIYSIATHNEHMGQGVAAALLRAAERAATACACITMRLEIRKDNAASRRLFQSRSYRIFGEYSDYYEDGMDAFRLQKTLTCSGRRRSSDIHDIHALYAIQQR